MYPWVKKITQLKILRNVVDDKMADPSS